MLNLNNSLAKVRHWLLIFYNWVSGFVTLFELYSHIYNNKVSLKLLYLSINSFILILAFRFVKNGEKWKIIFYYSISTDSSTIDIFFQVHIRKWEKEYELRVENGVQTLLISIL